MKREAPCLDIKWLIGVMLLSGVMATPARGEDMRAEAAAAMRKAAGYFRGNAARHGGYVYYYSPDLKTRLGEGPASPDQIWVQPPGTPTVGMAYVRAYEATGDPFYLEAARATAEALVYGQLKSGGWTNSVDFDPNSRNVAQYRNGKGRGKNNSTLDDGISQAAIRCLMHVDRAGRFKNRKVNEAVKTALKALLEAQFPNGAFPQVWTGPVERQPIVKANYPAYDWKTEGRIKQYWTMYTLNDGVAGTVTETLLDAHRIYGDPRYKAALLRLGDFLLLAQMPAPQPAWAQQYNYQMQPIWARRFEPPAIAGRESQDVIAVLMRLHELTKDEKYIQPARRAIKYLKASEIADGRLARYYELKTNRPLYMYREGRNYKLTYSADRLPKHYGWQVDSRADTLESLLERQQAVGKDRRRRDADVRIRKVLDALDDQGRWMSVYADEPLVGQPKFRRGDKYLSSAVFSENMSALSDYLQATK